MTEEKSEIPEEGATGETKAFYKSTTFWALIVAVSLSVFDIPLDQIEEQYEQVGSLVAIVVGLYGRQKASQPLDLGFLSGLLGKK